MTGSSDKLRSRAWHSCGAALGLGGLGLAAGTKGVSQLKRLANLKRRRLPRPTDGARVSMLKLEGRVALVTGASRGIGRAIALALAREGARVAVNYVESERLAAEVVEEVIGFGGEAVAVRADVASPREVDDLVGGVGDRLGAIDVLVNNASVVSFYALPDLELAEFDRIINTNLRSAFLCTKAVLPGMLARRGGRIINVSSTSGICGPPESAHYCASKGGVNTFTKACATDLRRYNITVNAICPGPTETDMLVPRLKAQGFEFDPPDSRGPERRLGRAVDMAGCAVFLASDEASWVSGSLFVVDGGSTCA